MKQNISDLKIRVEALTGIASFRVRAQSEYCEMLEFIRFGWFEEARLNKCLEKIRERHVLAKKLSENLLINPRENVF